MKRFLSLILALMLLMSLAACGDTDKPDSPGTTETPVVVTETAAPETTAPETEAVATEAVETPETFTINGKQFSLLDLTQDVFTAELNSPEESTRNSLINLVCDSGMNIGCYFDTDGNALFLLAMDGNVSFIHDTKVGDRFVDAEEYWGEPDYDENNFYYYFYSANGTRTTDENYAYAVAMNVESDTISQIVIFRKEYIELDNAESSTESSETVTLGQQNALKSAKQYLDLMAFSYSGLIDQLEYEGYSTEEATYAVDNCGADWFEQAALCAENYLELMSFSKSGLIDQLKYEGFTTEQAEYAAEQVGY